MDTDNPFEDTRFCGFEKFKQWVGLKGRQQKKIDEQNEKKFKIAQKTYLEYKFKGIGTLNDAKHLLMEGAQNACPKSMEWLGILKVELGDNAPDAEKQKYYNDAFSWYVIAFWMQIIKYIKTNEGVVIPSTIISNLEILTKKYGFCQKRINYFNYLNANKKFVLNLQKSSDKKIFYRYIMHIAHNMYDNCIFGDSTFEDSFFYDRKFFVFIFNVFDFVSNLKNELKDNRDGYEKYRKAADIFLNQLATLFKNNKFLLESSFCYRNPTEEHHIRDLAILIINGQRKLDPSGQKMKEQDRNKIGSSLLWSLKLQENKDVLLEYILTDLIKFDQKGKNININNKFLILSKLCIEINSSYSLFNLALLIKDDLVNEIDGKFISKDQKYDIVGDFLRKSKSPEALVNYANLIAMDKIKKDINGVDISEGQQYEVAANLYRESKRSEALVNYANLIASNKIRKDIDGVDISEGHQYEVAANLYRECISKDITLPVALCEFGSLIHEGKIKKDINGVDISEGHQYEIAADFYRRSKSEWESLWKLGFLIKEGLVKKDLYGQDILEGQQYEVAADLYRKINNKYGLFELAILIYQKKISTDLDKNPIATDYQRDEIAIRLFLYSGIPKALYNVAIIKLYSPLGKLLEVKKEVLSLLMQAILMGEDY
ncbi:MAG: hypothetical protein Q8S31_01355, partial [Alphaproteobacteria bacterium]|nr:hypothetical protein [Alphaproteobacteria bacterium]